MAHTNAAQKDQILSGFLTSVRRFPQHPALEVAGKSYSYADLDHITGRIAATISAHDSGNRFAGLFAARSAAAYSGILAILRSGKAYVPLNPRFPLDRTAKMIEASGVTTIVIGAEALPQLEQLLPDLPQSLTFIAPNMSDFGGLESQFSQHNFLAESQLRDAESGDAAPETGDGDIAYLLFTSGSTGVPKGVPVSHTNVASYLRYLGERYQVDERDRFSQTFDLTFDLSVHDMFLCWNHGACLCCVPERSTMAPAKFIREQRISMWFSVPSVATFMQRLRLLKPGAFPSIRYSLFCGEPLLASTAQAWQEAATDSIVENLYGPTEATIAISHYRWAGFPDDEAALPNGVVPIGNMFPSQDHRVVNSSLEPVRQGEQGELCLSGSQVTGGYFNNPDKTAEQFVRLAGDDRLWYRTGDLVREDDNGCLYYLGRIDNQIQVLGHRVELQEVEHALRRAGNDSAVALGWPPQQPSAECLYAVFLEDPELDTAQVMADCKQNLPEYMVPKQILLVPQIPLNANGKVDRRALSQQIEGLIHE